MACCKEKCAWYLVHSKQCAIPLIVSELQKARKSKEAYDAKLLTAFERKGDTGDPL